MIPRASVLHCCPIICEAIPRRDWTLGDAVDAVHMHGVELTNTVPVNTGTVVLQMVVDINNHLLFTRLALIHHRRSS